MQKIIIELNKSSINNGRIYFKSEDVNFFPKSSLGDRASSGNKGSQVLFKASGLEFRTDIRQNSGKTLSPRSSFAKYIKEIKAIEGTKLLIERTDETVYLVSKHQS